MYFLLRYSTSTYTCYSISPLQIQCPSASTLDPPSCLVLTLANPTDEILSLTVPRSRAARGPRSLGLAPHRGGNLPGGEGEVASFLARPCCAATASTSVLCRRCVTPVTVSPSRIECCPHSLTHTSTRGCKSAAETQKEYLKSERHWNCKRHFLPHVCPALRAFYPFNYPHRNARTSGAHVLDKHVWTKHQACLDKTPVVCNTRHTCSLPLTTCPGVQKMPKKSPASLQAFNIIHHSPLETCSGLKIAGYM